TLEQFPQLIRHQPLNDRDHDQQPTEPNEMTSKARAMPGPLARQRMDFLLLLPNRVRVVLEVDGQQHYSTNGKASPMLYAQMVSEDRQLKLSGYEVYRFGGHELDRSNGPRVVASFFRELFGRYDITLPPTITTSSN
ncbi:hypothetical protein ACIPPJ_35170, partial [Streptomyces sp. NPDC086091]